MSKVTKQKQTIMMSIVWIILSLWACGGQPDGPAASEEKRLLELSEKVNWIDPTGTTIKTRFPAPEGFERTLYTPDAFGDFLQNQPLKPDGAKVHLFNGQLKANQSAHAAVFDIDVGKRDLQQCADAVMRLRAEYLFDAKRFADIHFNFVSGFNAEYIRWRAGERIAVKGNNVRWTASRGATQDYAAFRKYLTMVFSYAGTASLVHELTLKGIENIQVGDVFIRGGSPGHAIIVVDRVQHPATGGVRVLLAQSYMPAQDIHVLLNPAKTNGNPWYSTDDFVSVIRTPEWIFQSGELRAFR